MKNKIQLFLLIVMVFVVAYIIHGTMNSYYECEKNGGFMVSRFTHRECIIIKR